MQTGTKSVKPVDKCLVYGERPITELCLTMMTDDDLGHLVRVIELSDGGRIPFDGRSPPSQVFVEAPLGRQFGVVDILLTYDDFSVMCEVKPAAYDSVTKRIEIQIPRYLDSLKGESSRRQTALVKLVHAAVLGKMVYLVTMTKDPAFPAKLRSFYNRLKPPNTVSLGWVGYDLLSDILEREGYVIEGVSPNIWSRKRPLHKEENESISVLQSQN